MSYELGHKRMARQTVAADNSNVNQFIANFAKNYTGIIEHDQWPFHVVNDTNNQFPTWIEPSKELTNQSIYGSQMLNQHAMWGVDYSPTVPMNTSASINMPNLQDFGGYSLPNGGSTNMFHDGTTSISPFGVKLEDNHISDNNYFYQQQPFNHGQYHTDFPSSVNNVQSFYPNNAQISNGFKIPRLNSWTQVQHQPPVVEDISRPDCYDMNCNTRGPFNFSMENKKRKYDLLEHMDNESIYGSGTLLDVVATHPSQQCPPVDLPPLKDIEDMGSGPQVSYIIIDDDDMDSGTQVNNRVPEDAIDSGPQVSYIIIDDDDMDSGTQVNNIVPEDAIDLGPQVNNVITEDEKDMGLRVCDIFTEDEIGYNEISNGVELEDLLELVCEEKTSDENEETGQVGLKEIYEDMGSGPQVSYIIIDDDDMDSSPLVNNIITEDAIDLGPQVNNIVIKDAMDSGPQANNLITEHEIYSGLEVNNIITEHGMDTSLHFCDIFTEDEFGHNEISNGLELDDLFEFSFEEKTSDETGQVGPKEICVVELENANTEIISSDDNGPVIVEKPSASLVDSLTTSQIKQHLSSFIQLEETSVGESPCQLCHTENLLLALAPIFCSSCESRIKLNVAYYQSTYDKSCICLKCFRESRVSVILSRGGRISKANLQRANNDIDKEDSWVQCDRCELWQHRICGLYNNERDTQGKDEYICLKCRLKETENEVSLSNTFLGAKDLPKTNLSNHIEQRLFTRLKQERKETAKFQGIAMEKVAKAEGLVVRVVVSEDKELEVKQEFRDIFNGENYPEKIQYRSKLILLFQKSGGMDLCLFGMYVQEFGSECDGPNKRCVYISYLDSVKYFQPERKTATGESLRTFVYHEILIGYLEHCKRRGFTTCYIWSCPPDGVDYIFYCKPITQKTPKEDALRQWYKSMLSKAMDEGIVLDQTNIYKQFFVSKNEENGKITAARLPYFGGDYWSEAAQRISKELDQEEKENSGGLCNKLPPKRISMAMKQLDNPTKDALVMRKLGEEIRHWQEDLMIVRLQEVLSDINDDDEVLADTLFDSREDFLRKCENSQYQFDTLNNVKYSSMMILYHLTKKLIL